uniref:guanylate cyclase n=1 Tax=Plectus sambesii TaxID=2011161 RepID=A0A914WKF4_9BILA
ASLMSVKSVRTGSKSAVSTVGRARAVVGSNHACARIFVQMSSVQLDDKDLRLLFHLQQLVHDNLNPFLGMCFNDPNEQHLMILWKFCSRGSLQELIHNEDIRLEESFKNAFIRDIARGLQFLHSSAIGFHGGLRTSRCLIDNHFVVKLTDFGIEPMIARWKRAKYITNRPEQHSPSHKYLYAAPEMLRVLSTQLFSAPRILTVPQKQAADVYALGMILYEILFRRQPFEDLNTEDVLREIANHSSGRRLFRPSIAHEHENHRDLIVLMQSCWSEEPSARPSIKQVRAMTKRLTKSRGGLVDQMMGVMDQYTNNLEKLIKDRTKQIETTQKQADKLLKQMLPASIAAELKMGRPVQPKSYESATVLFSDIVGFTSLCADSSAMQVINFVNGMFTGFDAIIAEHDANKIETIGDAYMIVSGVPNENDTQHVMNIACVALAMRMYLFNYVIPHRHNQRLKCRIGVNTGPLAAGVVGRTAPKYCLFGDTVQIAALMENSGMPGKIQITNATHSLLVKNYPTFTCTPRGNINIAGKGTFITYWLDGKKKTT